MQSRYDELGDGAAQVPPLAGDSSLLSRLDELGAVGLDGAAQITRAGTSCGSALLGSVGVVGKAVLGTGSSLIKSVAPTTGIDLPPAVKSISSAALGSAEMAGQAVKAVASVAQDAGSSIFSLIPDLPSSGMESSKSAAAARRFGGSVGDMATTLMEQASKEAEDLFDEAQRHAHDLAHSTMGENAGNFTRDMMRAAKVSTDTLKSAHGMTPDKLARKILKSEIKKRH